MSTTGVVTGVRIPDSLCVDPQILAEVQQFYFFEAQLLDDRRFDEWLLLMAEDVHYWMPTRSNRQIREMAYEHSAENELAHFDDTKRTLGWRVGQVGTGMHWAEDPPSRTRHLVTNIRVEASMEVAGEYSVQSNFICYRNRLEDEVDLWAGERTDVLRRVAERTYSIAKRKIVLDQNVILSKNLSILF